MSIDQLHERMGWPERAAIESPLGAGPRVLTELAQRKIGDAIPKSDNVRVGLLTKNPNSDHTEAPVAVVCEFPKPVSDSTLALCHRLAWNFVRSPLLITVEPHQVRTWTCCEPPASGTDLLEGTAEIGEARLNLPSQFSPSEQAAHALHWVRLATGDFYRRFPKRFPRDGRADRILLKELTYVRRELKGKGLEHDTIHDLLARVVFSQFLFDRKDSDGRPALNSGLLSRLHQEKVLTHEHTELGTILADYDEAYRFFRWLNDKFNGDLFPGKGNTPAEREAEWREEMAKVQPAHLQTLADFVSGKMRGRQRVLWQQYSFDVIPLEFISSIYEEFVTTKGAHYTPGYLVDFMLDEVLPWDRDQWDLKILDPACGSGIFLVKAYQRLIQRWKNGHPDQKPSTDFLRKLLERNLFGVDIDRHAVRVASFSLYLSMCDELAPKTYLKSTKFPRLRDRRLIHADFFREDFNGFSTEKTGPTYDLVIGNAPWGRETETEFATRWAKNSSHKWPVPNKAVGTLFLAKAATLSKRDGRVSMIQPASSLLFNRSGPANRFREKLFSQFRVEEVVNLSTLRFELFGNATSPPCIVTLRPMEPSTEPLVYISPKQVRLIGGAEVTESQFAVVIEPHDISRIWPEEAISDPLVWTALAWGGRRDLALVRRLSGMPNLKQLVDSGIGTCRNGIERGIEVHHAEILGRRILETSTFPDNTFINLDASALPRNSDPQTHRLTDLAAFEAPQIIIKRSWTRATGRFQAVMVTNLGSDPGVICSQNYISVHVPSSHRDALDGALLVYNSKLAAYFLLLTSGRIASYRPNAVVEDLLSVPFAPSISHGRKLKNAEELDDVVRRAFDFRDAEWALVDDAFDFTLPDFHGDESASARQPTDRHGRAGRSTSQEPHLSTYCAYVTRVLKAGFGQDKAVCATIFQDAAQSPLPVRLVAVHLDWPREQDVAVEQIDSSALWDLLRELDQKLLQTGGPKQGGIFFQRVARVYSEYRHNRRSIPTVYIIKPDRVRYWTRSAALRDADEVAADVHLWQQETRPGAAQGRK